jgi:trans-aconitate methyltransferase
VIDTWDPRQYDKFEREREQPFYDLLALVHRSTGMRVVDLGCGTGKLTRVLHERLDARETIGLDRSEKMLESIRGEALPHGCASKSAQSKRSRRRPQRRAARTISSFRTRHTSGLTITTRCCHVLPRHSRPAGSWRFRCRRSTRT